MLQHIRGTERPQLPESPGGAGQGHTMTGRGVYAVSAHKDNASLSLSPKPRVVKGRSIQLQPSTMQQRPASAEYRSNQVTLCSRMTGSQWERRRA